MVGAAVAVCSVALELARALDALLPATFAERWEANHDCPAKTCLATRSPLSAAPSMFEAHE